MLPYKIIIVYLQILMFVSLAASMQNKILQRKKIFQNKKVFLDRNPMKNNTFLYALCNVGIYNLDMRCQLVLENLDDIDGINNKSCEICLHAPSDEQRISENFQLIHLDEDRVIFSWQIVVRNESSSILTKFRIVRMSLCQEIFRDEIALQSSARVPESIAYFVPYGQSFDVFFPDDGSCGDKMCGRTYSFTGNLILGPAPSFLPSSFFAGKHRAELVYPVKPKSPLMGHFVISDRIRLVSSRNGEVTELTDGPTDTLIFSPPREESSNYGYCAVPHFPKYKLACKMYSAIDDSVTAVINATFEREIIELIAMRSLADGYLLLLRFCNDYQCTKSSKNILHYLVRLGADGQVGESREIDGLDCPDFNNKVQLHGTDVHNVCVNFICRGGTNNARVSHLNVISSCTLNN